MRPRDHGVKIGKAAEHRIDVAIIADVIAEVFHRTGEKRADPDGIRPQFRDVIQPLHYAAQIADPVAVAVLKAAGIDLIDHGPAPPVTVRRQHCSCHLAHLAHLLHRTRQQPTHEVFLHRKENQQRHRDRDKRRRGENFPIPPARPHQARQAPGHHQLIFGIAKEHQGHQQVIPRPQELEDGKRRQGGKR